MVTLLARMLYKNASSWLSISVKDESVGMDKKLIDQFQEPFFQNR